MNGMSCHFDLLQKTSVRIFEVNVRYAITTPRKRRSTAVVHAEQSGFLATLVHLVDEVEEVGFRAAKRIVVLVAIQDAHGHPPIGECGPGIVPQKRVDFAGDCRKRRCWPRPRAGFPTMTLCGRESK